MKSIADFKASLTQLQPNDSLAVQLKSLWYDGVGDWQQAHNLIDHLTDRDSAWVHAYLHRKEGDIWNADYWYNRAHQTRPSVTLDEEWEALVDHFLK
ncbi:hypothetical protein [Mucilaginibacter ginkgonis]|uniref:Uncharacterized protein n=1 Tax=Mucilaginibacter ginkgonis TaxID=2682091 RepID=A0A6I4I4R1_9SPHI|nr:hypothetical protein [Mucilaginibacter ginkgonis]QQL48969.1 hypothetical protein GO620_012370 [Mucilaginibacter ginkgonis]